MSEGLSAERLAELEAQWAVDPTSRAFVQLAEEYRRLGNLARAAGVLTRGLESHPQYLSALVALGRCRLELGDAPGAVEALRRALAQDPALLVANKLLVEAHLAQGQADEARERLDFYRLFNDRDEEIEALEARIAAASAAPVAPLLTEAGALRGGPVFDLDSPTELPPLELIAPRAAAGRRADPFGALYDAPAAQRRIAEALAAGGVFAAPPAPPPVEPRAATAAEPVLGPEPLEPPVEPAPAPPWGGGATAADLEQEVEEEVVAEPFRPRTIGEEVERETIEEPFDEVLQAPSVGPRALEPTVPGAPEPEPGPEPEPEEAPGETEPSATLGELYLSQGHLDEAESEFRRVLALHPGEATAAEGLREIARRRSGLEETASGWAEDAAVAYEEPSAAAPAEGLTSRKVHKLRDYLERIRSRREGARVS